jgi:hypothetical protein
MEENEPRIQPTVISLKGRIREFGPSLENSPKNLLYIGRSQYQGGWKLNSSKWANPSKLKGSTREDSLKLYREYILTTPALFSSLPELEGKILACWCHNGKFGPADCHADVLIELYNEHVK